MIIIGVGILILGGFFIFKNKMSTQEPLQPIQERGITLGTSVNPLDNRQIGYEFLNDTGGVVSVEDATTVHIWNTQDDYYFNKSSGIQFTNHFQDYWTKNVFCIGYYANDTWNKINCADELDDFNRTIDTDNSTYVNATLWKEIIYSGYNMRLAVNYYLGLDDNNLTITIDAKNTGIDIPFELGFAWKVQNFQIPPSENGDSMRINGTDYNLNGTYDLLFTNMTSKHITFSNTTIFEPIPYFRAYDGQSFLRLDWNENLNYAVKMYGDGNQSDFYTAVLINVGTFTAGQEKSTQFYWIDAYDSTSSDSTTSIASSFSFTHTQGSLTNGYVIVKIADYCSSTDNVASVTYDGTGMDFLSRVTHYSVTGAQAELWGLAVGNKGSGSYTVQITMSASCGGAGFELGAGASSFSGIDQTVSNGTATTNTGSGGGTTESMDVTTESGDTVIDVIFTANPDTPSVGANQGLLFQQSPYDIVSGSWENATGTTTTMSWSGISTATYLATAIPLKPVSSSDSESPQWSDNSTNSTVAGQPVIHSVAWTDNINLDNYVFSYCNGSYNQTINTNVSDYRFSDDFETDLSKWDGNGATSWTQDGTHVQSGTNALYSENGAEGDIFSDDINATNATHINITFWAYIPSADDTNDLDFYLCHGATCNLISNFGSDANNTWVHEEYITTDSQYFTSDFHIRINSNFGTGESVWIDDVLVNITSEETSSQSGSCLDGSPVFLNASPASFTGTSNWSNITMITNSTVGSTIKWGVYAFDNSSNANFTGFFSYNTTSGGGGGATCWTYDSGSKLLIIPSGCVYNGTGITGI